MFLALFFVVGSKLDGFFDHICFSLVLPGVLDHLGDIFLDVPSRQFICDWPHFGHELRCHVDPDEVSGLRHSQLFLEQLGWLALSFQLLEHVSCVIYAHSRNRHLNFHSHVFNKR